MSWWGPGFGRDPTAFSDPTTLRVAGVVIG